MAKNNDNSFFVGGIRPWVVWGLGCLFYFYEFFLQVSPNVMQPELMHDFTITATQFGIFGSIYFYSYTAMQIPVGILLDRFGPHKLLTIASLICATGTLLFGMSEHFSLALLSRFLVGFGSAFAVVSCMKLAANWFPQSRFALLTGLMVMVGMFGAISGERPLAMLLETLHWRQSMFLLGSIGFVICILIFTIVRNRPVQPNNGSAQTASINAINIRELIDGLKVLTRNPQVWLTAGYGGLVFTTTPAFCGLWGASYLMLKYNITRPEAAHMISFVFYGWVFGGPLSGWFTDFIGKRLPAMRIAAVTGFIFMLIILYYPNLPTWGMFLTLFYFGFFSAGFLPAFSLIREIAPRKNGATSLAFMNTMNMIGVPIAQTLVGLSLDWAWNGDIVNGVRHYTLGDYQSALIVFPIMLGLSLFILPFIKETYCKFVSEE